MLRRLFESREGQSAYPCQSVATPTYLCSQIYTFSFEKQKNRCGVPWPSTWPSVVTGSINLDPHRCAAVSALLGNYAVGCRHGILQVVCGPIRASVFFYPRIPYWGIHHSRVLASNISHNESHLLFAVVPISPHIPGSGAHAAAILL